MEVRICMVVFALAVAAVPGAAQTPDDLWADTTLYRDGWGVPHIYADTPLALGFAFGQAQAEDHLEAMLLAYRMATGRAAAVLGEAYAESDAFALRLGHDRLAREAMVSIDPLTGAICTGFTLGVNAWIATYPDRVPDWAEGVQPHEILALWHAFLVSMAPLDLPEVYRPSPAMPTANAWAVAPDHTIDGMAILAINPHQYHDSLFRWYEAHLVWDDLDVSGATLMGLPVIVQGHNGVLGWALTPNGIDFADVYEERIEGPKRNPRDPRLPTFDDEQLLLLRYMSQAQPYYVRTESGMEERFIPALMNARGPILEGPDGALFSWRIGGYRDFGGLFQLLAMGRAQHIATFHEALLLHQFPCFNLVYADRDGNIFHLYNGKVGTRLLPNPKLIGRRPYPDWKTPLPMAYDSWAWRQIAGPTEMPYVQNPDSGFVQACGGPPWLATDDAPLDPGMWPPWLIVDEDTLRARRVRQLLRSGARSFRELQAMLYDLVLPGAAEMTPLLLDMADAREKAVAASHPDLSAGLDLLRNWTYVAETDSAAMTFYHLWWNGMRAMRPGMPDAGLYRLMSEDPQAPEIALEAAANAARTMRNVYERMDVPWGEVHRLVRGERDEAVPGASTGEPLFVASDHRYDGERWHADYGYGFAMTVQFGEFPEAVSIVPFGASEQRWSPHYDDQLDLLLGRRFKRTRYRREEVWRYAERAHGRHVTLHPLGVEGAVTVHTPIRAEVWLRSSAQPPAPIPGGLTAFTLYVSPEWQPREVKAEVEMALHVPEAICAPGNLSQLALYTHRPAYGWQPLADQVWDTEVRTLAGALKGAATFAVLGPAPFLVVPLDQAPRVPERHTPAPFISPEGRDDVVADSGIGSPVESGPIFKIERGGGGAETKLPAQGMAFGPDSGRAAGSATLPEGAVFKMEAKSRRPKAEAPTETTSAVPAEDAGGNVEEPPRTPVKLPAQGMAFGPDAPRRGRSTGQGGIFRLVPADGAAEDGGAE